MGFITAGLLSGLGKGLTEQSAQMREDALIKLKRQYQLEDNATAQQDVIAKENRAEDRDVRTFQREGQLKVGLLGLAQQYKQQEGETEQAYKERLLRIKGTIDSGQITQKGQIDLANDKALAVLKASLDKSNDAASQLLKQQIDRGETTVAGRTPDGFIIVKRGDGTLITTRTKMAAPGKSEGDDTSIEDIINKREGGAAPASAPAPARAARPAEEALPPEKSPVGVRQIQASVNTMMRNNQLGPGKQVGDTITVPAGALAATSLTLSWDGKRWVYRP